MKRAKESMRTTDEAKRGQHGRNPRGQCNARIRIELLNLHEDNAVRFDESGDPELGQERAERHEPGVSAVWCHEAIIQCLFRHVPLPDSLQDFGAKHIKRFIDSKRKCTTNQKMLYLPRIVVREPARRSRQDRR